MAPPGKAAARVFTSRGTFEKETVKEQAVAGLQGQLEARGKSGPAALKEASERIEADKSLVVPRPTTTVEVAGDSSDSSDSDGFLGGVSSALTSVEALPRPAWKKADRLVSRLFRHPAISVRDGCVFKEEKNLGSLGAALHLLYGGRGRQKEPDMKFFSKFAGRKKGLTTRERISF